MSYYPPAQGGYGYPYPPQQQYAAGAPIPGYPVMQQQPPPPQQGYYPPQGPPPGSVPIGAPGYSYYPQPQGPPPPMHHAPPPSASPYGYPSAAPPAAPMVPVVMPVATMPVQLISAPTMPMQAPTSYFAPGTGGPVPTPQQDAETIHRACKGFGTDERSVISVVACRTSEHLAAVASVYKQFYGRDLVDVLDKETSGHFGRALHYLILPPIVLDAELLHEAIMGAGTNERCLIQILVGRSNADMAQLKNMYYTRYRRNLESDVRGDVSGYFEKLLMICLQGTRDEMGQYQYNVEADVHSLYKAGEGRIGTDESHFIHVLTNRPDAHLRAVFQQYQSRYGKKFTKVIKKEFSGWIKTALCYLVNWTYNPAHCIAKNLEKSMEGVGTDDKQLTRLLVRNRAQPFMNSVKAAYLLKYRRSLRDRVKGETSGDYRRTLLSTLGEPEHY